MHTLFLDANVLFSAAYRENAGICQFWQLPNTPLITSSYAVQEAKRNLKQAEQIERLDKLLMKTLITATAHQDNLIPTSIKLAAKDRPILSAAILAKANYLITGDYKDFGQYYGQSILEVTILPPAQYLQIRKLAEK